jgi:siroheme decarboxylase
MPVLPNALELCLLNDFQRAFPLTPQPFGAIAERLGVSESSVLAALHSLLGQNCISRIGAVFAPRRLGASTLAAMAVPPEELAKVAALVSAYPGVNHNYERENRFNLWFVAAAEDETQLGGLLRSIEREAGHPVISLPLQAEYHIDLGFDLVDARSPRRGFHVARPGPRYQPDAAERRLLAALQGGIEPVARPFARLADQAGVEEETALAKIAHWLQVGLIKRFGVIVGHRALGYRANAMVVWDVPEDTVDACGSALAAEPAVTLCYRRTRCLPHWRYNLFCMIHGRERAEVEAVIESVGRRNGLAELPSAVLFSRRCFKQQGAQYFEAEPALHG